MRATALITFFILSSPVFAQNLVKDFFKYSTVYTSAMAASPMQAQTEYFVTQSGELQDITIENPFDYRTTIGIRRVARFDYENRQNRFYDGHNQSNTSTSSTVGSVNGFEYLAQYDQGRQQGREYINQRYFLRYLSKYWMIKGEYYDQGLVNLNYTQIDSRLRIHVGELDFSAGVAARQHLPYGYNPIGVYLQNNPWWELAFEYGYEDYFYQIDYDLDGETDSYDWYWEDVYGVKVADTDEDFRRYIYGDIVNDYNKARFDEVGNLASLSAIFGVDYYHYTEDFWIHSWSNVLPYHSHVLGDHMFSYKNFVEHECGPECMEDMHKGVQWVDYSTGLILGYKVGLHWGFFVEGEYMKYWDRQLYSVKCGLNYQFR
jgi:hypothetical protein